jgi:hypothetical protein
LLKIQRLNTAGDRSRGTLKAGLPMDNDAMGGPTVLADIASTSHSLALERVILTAEQWSMQISAMASASSAWQGNRLSVVRELSCFK